MKKDEGKTVNEQSASDDKKAEKKENYEKNQIRAMGKAHGMKSFASAAVEKGQSLDDFREALLSEIEKRSHPPVETPDGDMGIMRNAQKQEFSFARLIASQIPGSHIDAEREKEVSDKITKSAIRSGRKVRGNLVPIGTLQERSLTVGTPTAGGDLVATNLQSTAFIDLLRNRTMALSVGATVIDGLEGNAAIPKQTGSSTAYFLGEDEAVTPSDPSFAQVLLTPKTIAARTTYSRQLLLQSAIDMESIIRDDLAKVLSTGMDLAAFTGTGTNNQPTGILNTSGIGSVVGGDNGAAPTYQHILELWSAVAAENADRENLSYLTNSKVIGKLMATDMGTDTGRYVVEELPDATGFTKLGGMRCGVTSQVPSNLDKGTATGVCSAIIFGNWKDLIIGMWGGLDVIVDPYTDSASGKVHVTAFLSFDVAVRHPESFAAMTDVLTT